MKHSLGISNFLKEISSLSHSVVFLYFFALIAEEGFLILLAILWNSTFRCLYTARMHTAGQKKKIHKKMFSITNQRNTNQNYNEVSPHTGQNGHYPKFFLQTIHAGKDVEGKEPSYTAGRKVN